MDGLHRIDLIDTVSGNLLDTDFFTLVEPPAISVIESTQMLVVMLELMVPLL